MKKLIAIFAILFFVAPAFAAEWDFYGSIRLGNWYYYRDYGNNKINSQNSDGSGMDIYFQGNSRLEAKVRADKVKGHIELGLGLGGEGEDTNVTTRRAYGEWKFSDNAWLKVGKDFSPVTEFLSSQWFDGDGDLLGTGNFFGRRPAGLTLGIGSFELAFLTPSFGGDVGTTATGINGATSGDADSYIPRLEACYKLMLGSGFIKPFAGFQWYTVEETGLGNVTEDLDVYSWVLGVAANWNIGAFTLGGQVSYGMNEGNVISWSPGYNPRASSSAYLKGGDDLANVYTLQAEIVPAVSVTDYLRFETGLGYRMDNADGAPGSSKPNGLWIVYLQAMVTMAPGVFLCPEVGYITLMDDRAGNDEGYLWYAGAKWQIDF
jgi:hypothetical protein